MNGKPISPGNILTVIIRDDSPMFHANDSPTYRSVRIELTAEQRARIQLRHESEHISQCFIEHDTNGEQA